MSGGGDTASQLLFSVVRADLLGLGENDDPWGLFEVAVHLLESSSLGLGEEEEEDERVAETTDGEDEVVPPADALQSLRGNLTDHEVGNPSSHGGESSSLGSQVGVEDLDGNGPGQGADTGRKGKVEDPCHGHKGDGSGLVEVRAVVGEACLQCSCDAEGGARDHVGNDQWFPSTELVDEEDAGCFAKESDDRVDGLKEQSLCGREAHSSEDCRTVERCVVQSAFPVSSHQWRRQWIGDTYE